MKKRKGDGLSSDCPFGELCPGSDSCPSLTHLSLCLLPFQDKLVSVEAGWEAELQDLKSSSTLSRDALDRLTTDLALVKSHLLKKETEVRTLPSHTTHLISVDAIAC